MKRSARQIMRAARLGVFALVYAVVAVWAAGPAVANVVLLDSSGTFVQNFGSADPKGYHTDGPSGGSGGLAYSSSPLNQAIALANTRAGGGTTGDIIEFRDNLDYQYGGTPGDIAKMSVSLRDNGTRKFLNDAWCDMFPDEDDRPARHTQNAEINPRYHIQIEFTAMLDGA